jgi:hypothetical protein
VAVAVTKIPLSASTHGRPVKVAATAIASGTTVHTSLASTTDGDCDEIYLWATNTDSATRTLTLGWGGVTDPDDLVYDAFTLPAGAHVQITWGLILRNALIVKAAASAANVVILSGFVIRFDS